MTDMLTSLDEKRSPDDSPQQLNPEATDAAPTAAPPSPPKVIRPQRGTVIAMILLFVVGATVILYAWRIWPFTSAVMTTENAYVRGQITAMAPQVNGYVTEVGVRDFAHVKKGQVLMRIDDRIYRQQLEQALAQLRIARANLANWSQTLAQNEAVLHTRQADLAQARAEMVRARADLVRVGELASRGSVSIRERDQVRATTLAGEANIARAEANIEAQRQTIRATEVSRESLEGAVAQARAAVDLARINLANTYIRAPRDGQISEASVRVGQYVSAGSQLLFLVPEQLWVVANFKETQVARMQIGQTARFSVDALEGAWLSGRVEELAPATGSEFSVLRPDNASGNFTKVVQRIPVRIAVDPDEPLAKRLRPGMSVLVKVDTSGAPAPGGGER
jgi:multidrug resistance efflux pump